MLRNIINIIATGRIKKDVPVAAANARLLTGIKEWQSWLHHHVQSKQSLSLFTGLMKPEIKRETKQLQDQNINHYQREVTIAVCQQLHFQADRTGPGQPNSPGEAKGDSSANLGVGLS